MKKLFQAFIVILISFSSTSFVNKNQNQLENGFYYLAENEEDSEIVYDVDSDDTFGIEKTPIITSIDFVKVNKRSDEIQNTRKANFEIIDVTLKNKSENKWREILGRISKTGESIIFVFENKVIIEKKLYGYSINHKYYPKMELPVNKKYVDNFLNKIKLEIKNHKINRKNKK